MRADAPRGQCSPLNVMGSTTIQILIVAIDNGGQPRVDAVWLASFP
jgi:hypothetical protein